MTNSLAPIESLEKLQRQDHDTLIRLESKVDGLITDIKDMKDGTAKTLADHEVRIRGGERVMEQVNPLETYKEFQALKQAWRDQQTKLGVWRWVTGIVSATLMFLLTQVPGVLRDWGLIR